MAFFGCQYIYIHSASKKDPTENGLCKCERRWWLVSTNYLHNVFSPLVLLARTTLRQTDRQTDITYLLLLLLTPNKTCSVIAKMIQSTNGAF